MLDCYRNVSMQNKGGFSHESLNHLLLRLISTLLKLEISTLMKTITNSCFQALEGLKFQVLEGLKFQNKQTQKQMIQTYIHPCTLILGVFQRTNVVVTK